MGKKGNLHALIRSMSKSEKRHFKLSIANGQSQKNYLDLFDAIDRQEEFDEKALRDRFKGRAFTRQLHVTKNYLSRIILKSLRNYHARVSKDGEIKDLLREVELLYRKELFDQCHYTLQKAEKLAETYEKFTALVEIKSWRRKLVMSRFGVGGNQAELNALILQEREELQRALRVNEYWMATMKLYSSGFGNRQPIQELLVNPLLTDESMATSLHAQVLRYHLLFAARSFSGGSALEGKEPLDELITLLESKPERIQEDPSSYITALNNKVGMLLYGRQTDAIPPILAKIRAIPKKFGLEQDGSIAIKMIMRTYNVEIEVYRDTKQADRGIAMIPEITAYMEEFGSRVPPEYVLSLHYQFAYLYFLKGEYNQALRWLHRIDSGNFGAVRMDIQSFARILSLIIHFELRNIIVLKYAVDATRRFLKKKRDLQEFEKILLRFFSRISTAGELDYSKLFDQLRRDLFEPNKEKVTAVTLDWIDLRTWVDTHAPKRKAATSLYPH